jgi:hypothetical protein
MTAHDLITLQHAHRKIMELANNQDLLTDISYELSIDTEKGQSSFKSRPSSVSVKAAVTDLRQFILEKSPIKFNNLTQIIYANVDSFRHGLLKDYANTWKILIGTRNIGLGYEFEMVVNDQKIDRKTLLDLMINGDIMHLDADKSQTLALMRGNPMSDHAEMFFMSLLQDMTQLLYRFDKEWIEPLINGDSATK